MDQGPWIFSSSSSKDRTASYVVSTIQISDSSLFLASSAMRTEALLAAGAVHSNRYDLGQRFCSTPQFIVRQLCTATGDNKRSGSQSSKGGKIATASRTGKKQPLIQPLGKAVSNKKEEGESVLWGVAVFGLFVTGELRVLWCRAGNTPIHP